jgi:hypothetical protein
VSTIDAFLSEDGLSLYFNMTPGAGETEGDLYVARRATPGEGFGAPEPLDELNTPGDERDPWLSPDGRHLFYASSWDGESADGTLNIFEARLIEP